MAPMHMARFDTPVAVTWDRYILAIGGKTSRQHGTKRCEIYDTLSDQWHHLPAIPFFCVNVAAIVIKSRHVFLMPGQNRETQTSTSLLIGHLDTAALEKHTNDLGSMAWNKLWVENNPEFVAACPIAGSALVSDPYKMLIFGGTTN